MLLDGLHIPLTTPFHPDGRLNARKLASNVARYSKTPASGLIVLGPSGEPTLLSVDETRDALRAAAEAAAPEKVLIAGISRDSVHATLELANFAAELDYDAILVSVPTVLAAEDTRELLTYFQTVADRSPLPMILLRADNRGFAAETVADLAAHPRIIGMLYVQADTRDLPLLLRRTASVRHEATVTTTFAAVTARMKSASASFEGPALISASALTGAATAVADPPALPMPRTRTKSVGFQIISARAPTLLDALNAGSTAIAPAFAACAPQTCYEVFAAWKDDDQPLAEEKQSRLREAANLTEALGPGGLKFACDLNGYFGGPPRLPHLPPTGEQRAELQRQMQPLRN